MQIVVFTKNSCREQAAWLAVTLPALLSARCVAGADAADLYLTVLRLTTLRLTMPANEAQQLELDSDINSQKQAAQKMHG
ncbi:hypothetical protein ACFPT7_04830 [Acidicapsa dinghuensis]|uniref:Uncharacterized protein n=1 Tax=Acidicapsa dinghuensis TaxID=2218256 RepID=A0ABW1EBD3_9BACT|nr:hypothetical protein [Acidicapsa dinghuensis]